MKLPFMQRYKAAKLPVGIGFTVHSMGSHSIIAVVTTHKVINGSFCSIEQVLEPQVQEKELKWQF